jgi:hypothetical protein
MLSGAFGSNQRGPPAIGKPMKTLGIRGWWDCGKSVREAKKKCLDEFDKPKLAT